MVKELILIHFGYVILSVFFPMDTCRVEEVKNISPENKAIFT